jgi:hypothetical protein
VPIHLSPLDRQAIARLREEASDVAGPVRELVANVLIPASGWGRHAIDGATPVAVEQTSQELPCMRVQSDGRLPRFEHDPSGVLLARAALWKHARPVLRLAPDVDCAATRTATNGVGRHHSVYRVLALSNHPGIPGATRDEEPVHASPSRNDRAIAKILAKQIGIGGRTHVGAPRAQNGTPRVRPSTHRRLHHGTLVGPEPSPHSAQANLERGRDLGRRAAIAPEGKGFSDDLRAVHAASLAEHVFGIPSPRTHHPGIMPSPAHRPH